MITARAETLLEKPAFSELNRFEPCWISSNPQKVTRAVSGIIVAAWKNHPKGTAFPRLSFQFQARIQELAYPLNNGQADTFAGFLIRRPPHGLRRECRCGLRLAFGTTSFRLSFDYLGFLGSFF
jgi:hypothetical protein